MGREKNKSIKSELERRKIHLIIGVERSGTSLLAGLLANSGATFGLQLRTDWVRSGGSFEHPKLLEINKVISRLKKQKIISDRLNRIRENKIITLARSIPEGIEYLKFPLNSHLYPYYFHRAGFDVKLIVSLRKFSGYFTSKHRKNGAEFKQAKEEYINIYGTICALINLFPAVVITYEGLISNPNPILEELGKFTDLSYERLIGNYQRITKHSRVYNFDVPCPECDELYQRLHALGKVNRG